MSEIEEETKVLAANAEVEGTRVSLSQQFPKMYTFIVVVGILINIEMVIFAHTGVSAQFKSTVCPAGLPGCEEIVSPDDLVGACSSNPFDAALLAPESPAFNDVIGFTQDIALGCSLGLQCAVNELINEIGFSRPCATCFSVQLECVIDVCIDCIARPQSAGCLACFNEICKEPFEECTGINFPTNRLLKKMDVEVNAGSRMLQIIIVTIRRCFDRDEFDYFNVFNLTFADSIRRNLYNGSTGVGVVLLVLSGIWPYAKNVLIAYVWFAELTKKKRDSILRTLALFGKWSLVYVFAVVMIIAGVEIDKDLLNDTTLGVFAESRSRICIFAVATIWTIAQGEMISYLDKKRLKESQSTNEISTSTNAAITHTYFAIQKLRVALGFLSILSAAFGMTGILLVNVLFTRTGRINFFSGPDGVTFTTAQFPIVLVYACALYDGHESIEGTYFLAIFFFLMAIIIPILTNVMMLVVSLTFSPTQKDSRLVRFTLGLANYASLDVYLLSVIVVVNQCEELMDAMIGEGVDAECGVTPELKAQGEVCVSFKARLEIGFWLILVASVLFWVSQVTAGSIMAKS